MKLPVGGFFDAVNARILQGSVETVDGSQNTADVTVSGILISGVPVNYLCNHGLTTHADRVFSQGDTVLLLYRGGGSAPSASNLVLLGLKDEIRRCVESTGLRLVLEATSSPLIMSKGSIINDPLWTATYSNTFYFDPAGAVYGPDIPGSPLPSLLKGVSPYQNTPYGYDIALGPPYWHDGTNAIGWDNNNIIMQGTAYPIGAYVTGAAIVAIPGGHNYIVVATYTGLKRKLLTNLNKPAIPWDALSVDDDISEVRRWQISSNGKNWAAVSYSLNSWTSVSIDLIINSDITAAAVYKAESSSDVDVQEGIYDYDADQVVGKIVYPDGSIGYTALVGYPGQITFPAYYKRKYSKTIVVSKRYKNDTSIEVQLRKEIWHEYQLSGSRDSGSGHKIKFANIFYKITGDNSWRPLDNMTPAENIAISWHFENMELIVDGSTSPASGATQANLEQRVIAYLDTVLDIEVKTVKYTTRNATGDYDRSVMVNDTVVAELTDPWTGPGGAGNYWSPSVGPFSDPNETTGSKGGWMGNWAGPAAGWQHPAGMWWAILCWQDRSGGIHELTVNNQHADVATWFKTVNTGVGSLRQLWHPGTGQNLAVLL